ncbi:hypothetical protein ACNKHM_04210 [Shigella sonnei]
MQIIAGNSSLARRMSPSYDAAAWNRLAKCYRDTLPGVALYASLQAERRQPDAWQHRAVAYQAYQVEDYATALAAWQKISLHDMSNEDLLAAADTAQAAGMVRLAIAGFSRQNNVGWETMPSTGGCMRNVGFLVSRNLH